MDETRRCENAGAHEPHAYWINRHGDDAYDEKWQCPGVPLTDEEERRARALEHRNRNKDALAHQAAAALEELDVLAGYSPMLWPDEQLTIASARSLCERLAGMA